MLPIIANRSEWDSLCVGQSRAGTPNTLNLSHIHKRFEWTNLNSTLVIICRTRLEGVEVKITPWIYKRDIKKTPICCEHLNKSLYIYIWRSSSSTGFDCCCCFVLGRRQHLFTDMVTMFGSHVLWWPGMAAIFYGDLRWPCFYPIQCLLWLVYK